jgi:phenylacetate-CoA ligase
MVQTPEVTEYQVHQTRRGIDVGVVASDTLLVDDLAVRLRQALSAAGLERPDITVTPVDRLERNNVSGKLRRFIPLLTGYDP